MRSLVPLHPMAVRPTNTCTNQTPDHPTGMVNDECSYPASSHASLSGSQAQQGLSLNANRFPD